MKRFVNLKSRIGGDTKHKFAVASFVKGTQWHCPLTSMPDKAIAAIDSIQQTEDSGEWNADSFFDDLLLKSPSHETPEYVLRVVLLYFRAQQPPVVDQQRVKDFASNKACFVDILYVHDKPYDTATRVNVQTVFDRLHDFYPNESTPCYMLETTMYRKYVAHFARFLAHAQQRTVDGWLGIDPENTEEEMELE
ncbi:hypothetical protein HDU98_004826, partial [Podochytrium sp. JEL0797]